MLWSLFPIPPAILNRVKPVPDFRDATRDVSMLMVYLPMGGYDPGYVEL